MDGITVKPRHAQIMVNVIALGVLSGLSLAMPALGLLCAFLVPLFSCPLVKHKEEWLSWASGVVPAACWLIAGYDAAVGAALLLPALVPVTVTRLLAPKDRVGPLGFVLYTTLTALSAAALLGIAQWRLGAPLSQMLPDLAVAWIRASDRPGMLLYRLASARLVTLPEGCSGSELLQKFVSPFVIQQTLYSFRRTAELFVQLQLPMYVMHACLLIGLFTTLRVERLNGVMLVVEIDPHHPQERKTRVTTPPGFRMFAVPRPVQLALAGMFLLSAMLVTHNGFSSTLGLMALQLARTVFQLTGAAVMVHVFAARQPDSTVIIGTAVGLIYALLPSVPFIIGLTDSIVHYRTSKVRNPDSDS